MTWDPSEEGRGEKGAEAAEIGEVAPEVEAEEREARGGGVVAEAGVRIDEEREEVGVETETIEKRDWMMTREILRNRRRERKKVYHQ